MDSPQKDVLDYWDDERTQSMFDKHLLHAEIRLIGSHIPEGARVLDVGCGEGEATLEYSQVANAEIVGLDFSSTRLRKARKRLAGRPNVRLFQADITQPIPLNNRFDRVVTQRCLINLTSWSAQLEAIKNLSALLEHGGQLLLFEGSVEETESLDSLRAIFGLEPLPLRWHNLFFKNKALVDALRDMEFDFVSEEGLGEYFALTRAVRPALDDNLEWDCEFNRHAASPAVQRLLSLGPRFSRTKLWVFEKRG